MADIQVLIRDDANRSALASVLDDQYSPITAPELQDANLYIVDDASLPYYHGTLETRKKARTPDFCPVVLINRERTPISIDLPNPTPDSRPLLIDETVDAPVGKQSLYRVVSNLLIRQQQIRDVQEKERLERFASTLRHEIRNPLNILSGWLDLAHETGDEEAFKRCRVALERMERMVENTTSILEGGDLDITRERVDLASLCEASWTMVPDANAHLELRTRQTLSADSDRLAQVLSNMFRNSVEHGGNDVTVEVGDLADGFYVEDDGPGIPTEDRKAVFEEGYSTIGSGSGLGLAVVAVVTDAHGWDVRLTESESGGARFEFTGVTRP